MKVIILAVAFVLISAISVNAQPNHPTRSAINLSIGSELQVVPDSLIRKYYPNGTPKDAVVIKAVERGDKKLWWIFMANKEEYQFLKKQVQNVGIQIVLDDEYFVGYTKMLIY